MKANVVESFEFEQIRSAEGLHSTHMNASMTRGNKAEIKSGIVGESLPTAAATASQLELEQARARRPGLNLHSL